MGPGFSPLSERLALVPGTLSPALAALAVQLGLEVSFGRASTLLSAATGTVVSAPTIRRLTEAAGAAWCQLELALVEALETAALDPDAGAVVLLEPDPLVATERVLVSLDGAMVPLVGGEWAEVRTLAIGRVARVNDTVRTTALSYASHLTDAATFGRLVLAEMSRRNVPGHPSVVAVTDGALWIQDVLDLHCPQARRILDFSHAAGYLAQAAQAAFGPGTAETSAWFGTWRHALRHGDPDAVLEALAALPVSPERDAALGYLRARRAMIAYPVWEAAGDPVGSGCVESANKVVVEARLKGAGMHWTRDHANAMVALRAVVASGRWMVIWPRIGQALREAKRARACQRRQIRVVAATAPAPPRTRLVVNGKPTADHPWRRHDARTFQARTRTITKR